MSGARWLGLILWLAYTAALGVLYAHLPPSPDQQIFDYIGWVASSGGTLYVDATEQNWPGAMWLHTAAIELFGNRLWSFRAFDYLLMLAASFALSALLEKRGARAAAWLVVPLYQGMYVTLDLWTSGQRDIVSAHVLLGVCLVFLLRLEGKSRALLALVGVAMVLVVMTRPTYLLFAPLLLLADFVSRAETQRDTKTILADVAVALVSFVGALGLLAAYAAHTGALDAWKLSSITFNTQIYGRTQTYLQVTSSFLSLLLRQWHWYVVYALLGLALWVRSRERRVLALLVAVALTGIGSAYAQRKGFGYHLGALIPVMAAFAAYFIGCTWEWARTRRDSAGVGLAACVLLLAVAGLGKKMHGTLAAQARYVAGTISLERMLEASPGGIVGHTLADAYRASAYVRRHSQASDTVLVWGRLVMVNTLAERRSATRFITAGMLELANPPFEAERAWNGELERALMGPSPPAVVLAPGPRHVDYRRVFERDDTPRALRTLRAALHQRYRKDRAFGDMDAYLLVR